MLTYNFLTIKYYAKLISSWDGSEETKPRTLLQQLGTEVIRYQIDNEFFIKRIIDDIKVLSYFCDIITISDARLPEELDLVTNINATGENNDYMSIKNDKLMFVLMKAIQEQQKQIEQLKSEIANIKKPH